MLDVKKGEDIEKALEDIARIGVSVRKTHSEISNTFSEDQMNIFTEYNGGSVYSVKGEDQRCFSRLFEPVRRDILGNALPGYEENERKNGRILEDYVSRDPVRVNSVLRAMADRVLKLDISPEKMTEEYSLPFKPVLLTGQIKGKARTEALNSIKSGECNLIIGTHALFQTAVEYNDLALVITDEQHRFGVLQREALANKSDMPHILIMSATPIPRTLALIIYGEICISTIHTMPEGRLPIKNCVVDTSYRPTAYKFLINEIKQGRQVYIICPQIEAGELVGVENVTDYSTSLSEYLPENIRIGVLHGQMTPQAKERVMEQFAKGNIDILVSTTVVEVGVNVPNATVMYIENAERFGLAQLHQLRGRVGRSDMQSYCIFMSSDASDKAKERLNILVNSNDGFEIANADMKLRGPGDIFGIRQSGDVIFKIGDIYQDAELIMWAKEDID